MVLIKKKERIVITQKCHLHKCEEKLGMLILLAASLLVRTLLAAKLVPQRVTPTWRTHTVSCNDNFVLRSAIDPELLLLFDFTYCFTLMLHSNLTLMMKTKN